MRIERTKYLQELIDRKHNGLVKVITGIRRCGKSYLLFTLFYDHLISEGVKEENIIKLELDQTANSAFVNDVRPKKKLDVRIINAAPGVKVNKKWIPLAVYIAMIFGVFMCILFKIPHDMSLKPRGDSIVWTEDLADGYIDLDGGENMIKQN